MRAQHVKDDRASGVANPKLEQDPIERRRLQNRLSQRNHRRKIRDRIAKLQERVIASELRAAASLNGWSYHHPTAPLVATSPAYEVERKVLSPAVEIMPAMSGPYLPGSTGIYPYNTLSPAPTLPPQPSPTFPQYEATAKDADLSSSSSPSVLTNSSACSPDASSLNVDMAPNMSNSYVPPDMNGQFQAEPWNIYTQNSQTNFYYMATEASLPQILQILDNGNLKPKAIILLQPNSHQADVPPLSTSQPPSPVEQVPATSSFTMQGLTCQCHNRNFLSEAPIDWMHPTASTNICPLHSSSPLDGYQQKLP
ncbi:hypothetical protein BDV38DRAFT_285061 [Aspergillus pseudotamarii]|uniref:BZIP domain-containing protein n=1 Tax=Aspergillus pseudotamarii TaxID=132259 RepID=A0A5N6SN98_ASPPS|nr:uncharacterized protein BDV38DRAFT_285061 [Aspergillus pseudotamarii]KAE8135230.1 hypothetical protein BDV38DRAFT_285061 [Aspergillus pseudotamarii]